MIRFFRKRAGQGRVVALAVCLLFLVVLSFWGLTQADPLLAAAPVRVMPTPTPTALAPAATPEEVYVRAKAAYDLLERNGTQASRRANWLDILQQFQQVQETSRNQTTTANSRFMQGRLYRRMYERFRLLSDLNKAIDAFDNVAASHPSSNLADDALYYAAEAALLHPERKVGAQRRLRRIVRDYASSDHSRLAEDLLTRLGRTDADNTAASGDWPGLVATGTSAQTAQTAKTTRDEAPPVGIGERTTPPRSGPAQPVQPVQPVQTAGSRPGPPETPQQGGPAAPPAVPVDKVLVRQISARSGADFTRISIPVTHAVPFTHTFLPRRDGFPPRLVIDLDHSRLAPDNRGPVAVDDTRLKRVRTGQYTTESVRVVLDLEAHADYKVFSVSSPFRIIVDVRDNKAQPLGSATPPARTVQTTAEPATPKTPETPKTPKAPLSASALDRRKAESPLVLGVGPAKPAQPVQPVKPVIPEKKPEEKSGLAVSTEGVRREQGQAALTAVSLGGALPPPLLRPRPAATTGSSPAASTSAPRSVAEALLSPQSSLAQARAEQAAQKPIPIALTDQGKWPVNARPDRVEQVERPERAEEPEQVERPEPPAATPARPPAPIKGKPTLAQQLGLAVRHIVIDPGHGGKDPGASGNGIQEKDVVLALARLVARKLAEEQGFKVTLTRNDDVFISLEERTVLANTQKADLFLSLHVNASPDRRAGGVETYYLSLATDAEAMRVAAAENAGADRSLGELQDILQDLLKNAKVDESSRLAQAIQRNLARGLKSRYRLKNLGVKKAPFLVLVGAEMPAVLMEVGFISNPAEAKLLQDEAFLDKVADEIVVGVSSFVQRHHSAAVPGK